MAGASIPPMRNTSRACFRGRSWDAAGSAFKSRSRRELLALTPNEQIMIPILSTCPKLRAREPDDESGDAILFGWRPMGNVESRETARKLGGRLSGESHERPKNLSVGA